MIRNFIRTCGARLFVDLRFVLLAAMAGAGCDLPQGRIAREMRGADTVSKEGVTVHYSKGLSRQAECFAAVVAKQMAYVRAMTSYELQPWLAHAQVYLKLVGSEASAKSPTPDWYAWELPLLVDRDKASCEDILAKVDVFYPFTWMHEIVEGSLVWGEQPHAMLDDRHKALDGADRDELHYTRWFREGFASYCSILASRAASYSDGTETDEIRPDMFNRRQYLAPFSSLAKVRTRIFAWTQVDDYTGYCLEKDGGDLLGLSQRDVAEQHHYNAALALFLLIEDRFGQEAIRQIGREVSQLKNGTGEDLRRIVSGAVGTDIVKVVDEFRFPALGLSMAPIYRPPAKFAGGEIKEGLLVDRVRDDSPAQLAGLKRDDVILSLEGERTLREFDFECALYKHMRQDTVKIGLWRKGAGRMTVEMKIGK
ncbi:MAG: PDZ domain-containing protein [Planctomycetota bacterium]|nr:PDZ domain-containing protein [Planctomycetota bacterium]